MRYLCLIYLDETLPLDEELAKGGRLVEADPLSPAGSITCVRVRNGRTTVTDGPFVETAEAVAGFCLVEARDLNEAIQVAARLPSAAAGTVEIRPTSRRQA